MIPLLLGGKSGVQQAAGPVPRGFGAEAVSYYIFQVVGSAVEVLRGQFGQRIRITNHAEFERIDVFTPLVAHNEAANLLAGAWVESHARQGLLHSRHISRLARRSLGAGGLVGIDGHQQRCTKNNARICPLLTDKFLGVLKDPQSVGDLNGIVFESPFDPLNQPCRQGAFRGIRRWRPLRRESRGILWPESTIAHKRSWRRIEEVLAATAATASGFIPENFHYGTACGAGNLNDPLPCPVAAVLPWALHGGYRMKTG